MIGKQTSPEAQYLKTGEIMNCGILEITLKKTIFQDKSLVIGLPFTDGGRQAPDAVGWMLMKG